MTAQHFAAPLCVAFALCAAGCALVSGLDEFQLAKDLSDAAGGTPTGCIPSDNVEPVPENCGVWVSSSLGDDGNARVRDAPLATLTEAAARAVERGTMRVYACGEEFAARWRCRPG